ncbi:MAG TPA: hypothetical protein ENO14_04055, partial [Chromatiales bacterium]|nr:hypothetical protein [Chromatiales bacterium]
MDEKIARLERQIGFLRMYSALLSVALLVVAVVAARQPSQTPEVLRVKGLVVEDAQGRERILIGAPIPEVASRVRTDTARVRRIWGPRFPAEYMGYYQGYRHDMNGMLVLDTLGFDRLAVGHDVPDPNIGQRIGRSTGFLVNDSLGFERTGYGVLTVEGKDRVVLGLDGKDGEAVALMVDGEGRAGMMAREGGQLLYLGQSAPSDRITGT